MLSYRPKSPLQTQSARGPVRYGDDDNGERSGSAYVFSRDHDGANNWGELGIVTAADGADGDYFGRSVSISGDLAIVGAYGDDDDGEDDDANDN